MALTQEQIDFEKKWAQRYLDSVTKPTFDEWQSFLKESSVVIRSGWPPVTGVAAIQGLWNTLQNIAKKWELSNTVITVDEENQRIISTFNSVGYLNADPEQKPMKFSGVVVVKKALGVGEEKLDSEESIADSAPFMTRMVELGMNPADIAKPSA